MAQFEDQVMQYVWNVMQYVQNRVQIQMHAIIIILCTIFFVDTFSSETIIIPTITNTHPIAVFIIWSF